VTLVVEAAILVVGMIAIYAAFRIARGQKRDQEASAAAVVETMRAGALQKAKPALMATAETVTPDEYRARHYMPPSNQPHLVVTLTNAGPGVATSARIIMNSGRFADRDIEVGPIGVGIPRVWHEFVEMEQNTMVSLNSTPTEITVKYAGDGWKEGSIEMERQGYPPTWRILRQQAPVSS